MDRDDALNLALEHYQNGHSAAAEAISRKIIAHDSNHPGAIHLMGMLALQAGQTDAAIAFFDRVIQLRPELAEAHANMGVALTAKGSLTCSDDILPAAHCSPL